MSLSLRRYVLPCMSATILLFAACAHMAEPELAAMMGDLQRFAHKVGLSIEAENQPLASFYLHEVEETLEAIGEEVPFHDEWPIGELVNTIMRPAVEPLEVAVEAGKWAEAKASYEVMIDGCNRCHTATEHEFLVMLPPLGANPYNQSFEHPTGMPEAE